MKGMYLVVATLAAASAGAATAQREGVGAAGGGTAAVAEMIACRDRSDPAERLSCFDRAAARIADARAGGRLIVRDRETVVAERTRAFGLPQKLERRAEPVARDAEPVVREIESTVTRVVPTGYGRMLLQLANGTVWQTAEPVSFPPAAGARIVVRAAALGAYRASVNGRRTILVKRHR